MSARKSSIGPNRLIVAEASTWFVSFRYDDVDDDARMRFSEWLRRSPQHIQAYLDIAGVWADLPDRDPEGRIDVPALILRARESGAEIVSLSTSGTDGQGKRARVPPRLLLAASITFLCLMGAVAAWLGWSVEHSYRTGVGEQRSLTLADGSTVDLNSRTRIRVRYSDQERAVELIAGQALFDVAKDPGRPFIVRSGDARVRAIGTRFDVYRKATGTVVTVIEGRVVVLPGRAESEAAAAPVIAPGSEHAVAHAEPGLRYVSAGEQLAVSLQAIAAPMPTDVAAATAWIQKKLIFDATPLREVAEEFNRYNRRTLVVEGADLEQLGISGVYSSTNPGSLLSFLRDLPDVQVIESDREIRITRMP